MYKIKLKQKAVIFIPFLFIILLLLPNCEQDTDDLGKSLLPSGEKIEIRFDSTVAISGYTICSYPIYSNNLSNNFIGYLSDTTMGISKANIVCRFNTEESLTSDDTVFTPDAILDSMLIYLKIDSVYTENSDFSKISIREIETSLSDEDDYLSNFGEKLIFNSELFATYEYLIKDSLGTVAVFSIPSSNALPFMNDSYYYIDATTYEQNLYSYFKGIYFTIESSTENFMIDANFFDDDSKVVLYYHTTTESELEFTFNMGTFSNNIARGPVISTFDNEYAGFPIEKYINAKAPDDNTVFISSLAGFNTILELDDILNWQDSMPIALNKAELIILPQLTDDSVHFSRIHISTLYGNNVPISIIDDAIDLTSTKAHLAGYYYPEEGVYKLNITSHVQNVIDGGVENYKLLLTPYSSLKYEPLQRIKFDASNESGGVKLEITYSVLD